ncbi:MAG: LPXTG cell wall anchor domain-containing protein [Acidimicrobiales bacterium]
MVKPWQDRHDDQYDDLAGLSGATPDWPARATATVVQYVDTVRSRTTGPALRVSRRVVYFTAIGLIAVVALPMIMILLVRLAVAATAYVPSVDEGESWLAYMILGVLFLMAGLLLWRKKEPA